VKDGKIESTTPQSNGSSNPVPTQNRPIAETNVKSYVDKNLIQAGKAKALAMGKNPICLASEERGVFITASIAKMVNNQFVFVEEDMLINVGLSTIAVSQVPGLDLAPDLAPGEWAIKVDGKFVRQPDRVDSSK